jgi:hypothetical protein
MRKFDQSGHPVSQSLNAEKGSTKNNQNICTIETKKFETILFPSTEWYIDGFSFWFRGSASAPGAANHIRQPTAG